MSLVSYINLQCITSDEHNKKKYHSRRNTKYGNMPIVEILEKLKPRGFFETNGSRGARQLVRHVEGGGCQEGGENLDL